MVTPQSDTPQLLSSHIGVEVHKWFHVVAVYDGRNMQLYINQAKVASNNQQVYFFLLSCL